MNSLIGPSVTSFLSESYMSIFGTIRSINGSTLHIDGINEHAKLGDVLRIPRADQEDVLAEIICINDGLAIALAYQRLEGLGVSERAFLERNRRKVYPDTSWLGVALDAFAKPLEGRGLTQGKVGYTLNGTAPVSVNRRLLGARLQTGLFVLDTFLPICRGQRVGIFAGSGVGKSTILGTLANNVDCDVVVAALIGERGREVRSFIDETLSESGKARASIIVSTADQSPLAKKRASKTAIAVAEKFRDEGKHVLLLFDSLTRFAEAHREVALVAGETQSSSGFPPSTVHEIASLVERTGPGTQTMGDITAIFSVLVAGSDMNEPVTDMVRGLLDGHIVLNREIAERGRTRSATFAMRISFTTPCIPPSKRASTGFVKERTLSSSSGAPSRWSITSDYTTLDAVRRTALAISLHRGKRTPQLQGLRRPSLTRKTDV